MIAPQNFCCSKCGAELTDPRQVAHLRMLWEAGFRGGKEYCARDWEALTPAERLSPNAKPGPVRPREKNGMTFSKVKSRQYFEREVQRERAADDS